MVYYLGSMNPTDCFILDCGRGLNIFIFMPEAFSVMLRSRVTQFANSIRDEQHGGNARVEIIDGFAEVFPYLEALGIKSTKAGDACDSSMNSTDTTILGNQDVRCWNVPVEQVLCQFAYAQNCLRKQSREPI